MNKLLLLIICLHLNYSCKDSTSNSSKNFKLDHPKALDSQPNPIQTNPLVSIKTRILPPSEYIRTPVVANSFGEYLRTLKLKPDGTLVKYYNGSTKSNHNVYTAVVDLKIGEKDLHQCADAVMRLRAEYLWNQKEFDKIHFNFTNGHKVEYKEWMNGKRMNIEGNRTWWTTQLPPSNTYQDFWNYLELIFMYAGTASLEKELIDVDINEAEIGDVIIQGGHPGHAVIIVDKAKHRSTGENIFLFAQSYMPAQEIQILVNPNNESISPWYHLEEGKIKTPEWTFGSNNIKRFKN